MLAVSIVPLSVLIFSPRPAVNGSISARMPWLTSRPPPFRPLRLLRIGGRLPRTAQTAEHTARSSASTRGQRTHRRAQWRGAQLYRVRIPSLPVAYLLTPGREDGNDERTSSPTTPPTLSCAPPTGATRTHPKTAAVEGALTATVEKELTIPFIRVVRSPPSYRIAAGACCAATTSATWPPRMFLFSAAIHCGGRKCFQNRSTRTLQDWCC